MQAGELSKSSGTNPASMNVSGPMQQQLDLSALAGQKYSGDGAYLGLHTSMLTYQGATCGPLLHIL